MEAKELKDRIDSLVLKYKEKPTKFVYEIVGVMNDISDLIEINGVYHKLEGDDKTLLYYLFYLNSILKSTKEYHHKVSLINTYFLLPMFEKSMDKNFFNYLPPTKFNKPKKLNFKSYEHTDDSIKDLFSEFNGTDELRPVLMSVNYNSLGLISTDAHKMLFLSHKNDKYEKDENFCVSKLCLKYESKSEENKLAIKNAKYPNWKQLVPQKSKREDEMIFNVSDFLGYLTICDNFGLYVKSEKYSSYNSVFFKMKNGNMLGFNIENLIISLNSLLKLGINEARMSYATERDSIILTDSKINNDTDYYYQDFILLMPVFSNNYSYSFYFDFNSNSVIYAEKKFEFPLPIESGYISSSFSDNYQEKQIKIKLEDLSGFPKIKEELSKLDERKLLREIKGGCSTNYNLANKSYNCTYYLYHIDLINDDGFLINNQYTIDIIEDVFGDTKKAEELAKQKVLEYFGKSKKEEPIDEVTITKELVKEKYDLPLKERKEWVNSLIGKNREFAVTEMANLSVDEVSKPSPITYEMKTSKEDVSEKEMNIAKKIYESDKNKFAKFKDVELFKLKPNEVLFFYMKGGKNGVPNHIFYEAIHKELKDLNRASDKIESSSEFIEKADGEDRYSTAIIKFNQHENGITGNISQYFELNGLGELYKDYINAEKFKKEKELENKFPEDKRLIKGNEYYIYIPTRGESVIPNSFVKMKYQGLGLNQNKFIFGSENIYGFLGEHLDEKVPYEKMDDFFDKKYIYTVDDFEKWKKELDNPKENIYDSDIKFLKELLSTSNDLLDLISDSGEKSDIDFLKEKIQATKDLISILGGEEGIKEEEDKPLTIAKEKSKVSELFGNKFYVQIGSGTESNSNGYSKDEVIEKIKEMLKHNLFDSDFYSNWTDNKNEYKDLFDKYVLEPFVDNLDKTYNDFFKLKEKGYMGYDLLTFKLNKDERDKWIDNWFVKNNFISDELRKDYFDYRDEYAGVVLKDEYEDEPVYIEYLDSKNKFKPTKKEFRGLDTFQQAKEWGKENLDNFKIDMIKFY